MPFYHLSEKYSNFIIKSSQAKHVAHDHVLESKNGLGEDDPVPAPLPGHLPLTQVAQGPIQPDLEHFQR